MVAGCRTTFKYRRHLRDRVLPVNKKEVRGEWHFSPSLFVTIHMKKERERETHTKPKRTVIVLLMWLSTSILPPPPPTHRASCVHSRRSDVFQQIENH